MTGNSIAADRRRRAERGFTLLEVLLAASLSVVLLTAVWSLLSTSLRLYSREPLQVEEARLVRAIMQQFSDDLGSALPIATRSQGSSTRNQTPPALTPGTATQSTTDSGTPADLGPRSLATVSKGFTAARSEDPVRPARLIGTPETLQLDVLQVFLNVLAEPREELDDPWEQVDSSAPRAPELRTVFYRFEENLAASAAAVVGESAAAAPSADADAASDSRAGTSFEDELSGGLLRLAWSWESTADLELDLEAPAGQSAGLLLDDENAVTSETPDDTFDADAAQQLASSAEDDPTVERVPEINWLQFRYFDGSRWQRSWDSRTSGSLPLAVEVQFTLRGKEGSGVETDEISAAEETELLGEGSGSSSVRPGIHRLIVYLAAATKPDAERSGSATLQTTSRESTEF